MSTTAARRPPLRGRLLTWLRHGLRAPGWAGLALLAAALLLVGLGQRQAGGQAPRLRPAAARPPVDAAAQAGAAALLQALPPADRLNADLASLVGWAGAQGLRIERAESRPVEAGGLPLRRVDLQLRLNAGYEPTRRWLVSALNGLPHAALRGLRVERGDAEDASVATQLTLRLHYRADGPGLVQALRAPDTRAAAPAAGARR